MNEVRLGDTVEADEGVGYGYGMGMYEDPQLGTVLTHSGGWAGFVTSFVVLPEDHVAVSAACTTYEFDAMQGDPGIDVVHHLARRPAPDRRRRLTTLPQRADCVEQPTAPVGCSTAVDGGETPRRPRVGGPTSEVGRSHACLGEASGRPCRVSRRRGSRAAGTTPWTHPAARSANRHPDRPQQVAGVARSSVPHSTYPRVRRVIEVGDMDLAPHEVRRR